MKKNYSLFYCILSVLMIFGIASCKKENQGGTGAPTVTRVRLLSKTDTIKSVVHRITLDSSSIYNDTRVVAFDSTVTAGRLGTQYGIIGTNLLTTTSVSINGVSIYFNPALLTDNSIIVTIPSSTSTATQVPFGPDQSKTLTIVTAHGTVNYTFPILQPAPVITSFTPVSANAGDIVTITGSIFNLVSAVRFDTTPAVIVGTPTATSIQVRVPAGVASSYIYVTTPGGTTKSPTSYGFKYTVYDDALATGWGGKGSGGYDGYNSTRDYANTAHPKRGNNATAVTFSNAYGALQIGYGGATVLDVKKLGLTSIKLSIYGGPGTVAGQRVQVIINNASIDAYKFPITISAGGYTDYTIPLSSLGNPTTITEIVVQSLNGPVPSTIYVDDIGFI
ncbi:MAG: hypothetical protein EOP45_01650 [Sphingobacteriaceae bacterium]|nr:MAG: hypothetical protein EOP45_01650 [Sphingobacteriaceae bacterium]